MKYDFDTVFDRRATDSLKWAGRADLPDSGNLLPLWVADMDFACPPEVADAVRLRAEHPIYGYPARSEGYYRSVVNWMERRHGWKVEKDWIEFAPGVVPALNFAVQAFSGPGDGIIIQPPVYLPFRSALQQNGRRIIENPLVLKNGRYVMDIPGLEACVDAGTKALILCSPHNPVGRVWERSELESVVGICHRHRLVLISDEIHSDLILGNSRHICAASLSDKAAEITVTLTAANKTFNIAGLAMANVITSNPDLRERFAAAIARSGISVSPVFGNIAVEAAYEKGEAWLEQLLSYLAANHVFARKFLTERLPELVPCLLEGTYLLWIDCSALGLDDQKLKDFFLKKAGVWLDEGTKFGTGGSGFMRMNFACPRTILSEALERIETAVKRAYPRERVSSRAKEMT